MYFMFLCFSLFIFLLYLQEVKREQSTQSSGRVEKREPAKTRPEKQNERPVIPDARVRHLKDQLVRARVYLSLSTTRNNPHFTRELRLRMKEVQRVLGDASRDSELGRKYVFLPNTNIAC